MEEVRRRNVKNSHDLIDKEEDATMDGTEVTEVHTHEVPISNDDKTDATGQRYWVAGMFFTRDQRLWNVVKISGRVLSSAVGLLILLFVYTLIGAVIFTALEAPNEGVVRSRITENRRIMLEKMWNMTSGNSEMTMENFVTDGEKLLKNYTDEVIAAFQAGITAETSESSKKWHFWGAVFYCLTVYTTIGYGHIAPATDTGRIATMIYAAIGIPLCLVVLVKVGKIFTRILKLAASLTRRTCHRIYVYCRRKHEGKNDQTDGLRTDRIMSEPSLQPDLNELIDLYEQQDSSFDVPIVVALLLVIVYILIGAALYRIWERWDYTEAVYFIFISISTIGFGDVLPEHPKFFLLVSVYIFVGLSLVSMVVNVLMDNMAEKLDKAQTRIKELATKENEESSKDVTDNTGSKVAETEETPSSPPKSPERGIIKNIIEKAQISKPDHPPRVDKIDLTCLSSCTKDE